MIKLIDTSAWIAFFKDNESIASLVYDALADASAALCGRVELELRQGLRPEEEKRVFPLINSVQKLKTEESDYTQAGIMLAALRRIRYNSAC